MTPMTSSFAPSLAVGAAGGISKTRQRLQCSALLVLADCLTIAAAFLLANLLFIDYGIDRQGMTVLSVLLPIYLGIASLHRAFHVEVIDTPWGGASRAIKSVFQAGAAILAIAYFLKVGINFSRGIFAVGMFASTAALPLERLLMKRWLDRLLAGYTHSVLVIRDDVDYQPVGHELVMTPAQLGFDPGTSDPLHFHALAHGVDGADRLLVACSQERYQLWSMILKSMAMSGEILTDQHDNLGIIGIGQLGERRSMIVASGALKAEQRFTKRALDLIVASVGLLLLSPLFLLVAIAIRLESPGPVLFRQDRIGKDNKIFKILKFRSMYNDACDPRAAKLTSRNDPRVTRTGETIRGTSIDELPQLINVLRGEMSIVGPRPHPLGAKAADLLYWDVDPRYRHRHSIKPGLTGLAQVRGFRGNTERVEDLTNRLQADLEYALGWSLWRDLQIIGRTVQVLLHHNAF